jgi:alkanesulfonate monooxygenase SsuD/methylene tetrahydromethanopterin reductase-like flavin-dependent oxidoreductase (luciferase family)
MFAGDETAFHGKHYQLERLMNHPLPLSKPKIPILIGGGGEKKTLRFVAQYADSCNLFGGPEVQHKLDVLKQHCDDVGRNYDEIEKTTMYRFDLGDRNERVGETIDELKKLHQMGFSVAHGGVRNPWETAKFEVFAKEIIPAIEGL